MHQHLELLVLLLDILLELHELLRKECRLE